MIGLPRSHSAIHTQASPLVPVAPLFPAKATSDQEMASCSPDMEGNAAYHPMYEQYVIITVCHQAYNGCSLHSINVW